jgi:hypothetical protein
VHDVAEEIMGRQLGFALGAALLCALQACGGGGGGGGDRSISGTVSGAVAAGVTVTLSGAVSRTTTTGAAGEYTFGNLGDGAYTVAAARAGYVLGPSRRAATVSGADLTGLDFSAAVLHDDFGSAGLLASRWSAGERQVGLSSGGAVLGHSMRGVEPTTSYATSIEAEAGGEVTSWQADVRLTHADFTGDTTVRAGIDLWFQPEADRLAVPGDQTRSLYARIALSSSTGGLVAQRQLFECSAADCSTSATVGAASGTWSGATPPSITLDTTYTVSISVNTATKVVTYSIVGGAISTALASSIDASGVSTPFPADFSAANQYKARLFTQVRGGAAGGGDGAVAARFDDVRAGVGGGGAVLFDDFGTGTTLDTDRWSLGSAAVERVTGGLQLELAQADSPARVALDVAEVGTSTGLQAGVKVTSLSHSGGGRIGARLAGTLYNDGTDGSGTPPDASGANSQVGDVVAMIGVTGTDVSYAVIRCDTALCPGGGYTWVREFTSLGTVALGEEHTLGWWWSAAAHTVYFQLDAGTPVGFDPTTAGSGYPVARAAQVPFRQIGLLAGDASASDLFAGGSGSVTAVFSQVGTF